MTHPWPRPNSLQLSLLRKLFFDATRCRGYACSFLKKYFIYLFLEGKVREGERGRGGKRESNISVWLPLVQPLLGTGLQPRHVP